MVLEELFSNEKYSKYISRYNSIMLMPILMDYVDENSHLLKMALIQSDKITGNNIFIILDKNYNVFIELTYDEKTFTKDTPIQEVIDYIERCMEDRVNTLIDNLIEKISDNGGKLKIYAKNDTDKFRYYLNLSLCYPDKFSERNVLIEKGQIAYAPFEYTNYILFECFCHLNDEILI